MTRRRRAVLFAVAAGFLATSGAVLPAAVVAPSPPGWAPEWLRLWAFDVRLAIAPTAKKVLSVGRINVPEMRLYRDTAGETVRIRSGELTLAGTLYRPPGAGPHPALLLLHGSTPEGRQLGLYRVLARELTGRGYVVLSLDHRGFGDSDDPPLVAASAFDFVGDAQRAVDYMAMLPGVDTQRLGLMGHSFGGGIAIAAGLEHPRIRKIVAIGPSRRFSERVETELDYRRRRAMHHMRLHQAIPRDVYLSFRSASNMQELGALGARGHKPLLLVDGSLESAADRRFMDATVRDSIAEPRAHVRLRAGDHYANTANVGAVVVYDKGVIAQLVDGIDNWLRAP